MNAKTKPTKAKDTEIELVEVEETGQELAAQNENPLAVAEPVSETMAMIQMIERAATNPDIDIEKMKAIMLMKNEHEDRLAEKEFNQSMAKTQSELQAVVHNQRNDHTKSGYADLTAIHASAKPIWTAHGFSVVSRSAPSEIENHTKILIDVRHAGGHKEHYSDDWPLDLAGINNKANKTAIQAKGSTVSYARRYSELMIFDVAVTDEDNDGNQVGAAPELSSEAGDWIAKINECSDLDALEIAFVEAFAALKGDGHARRQIIIAKDATKAKIEGRS